MSYLEKDNELLRQFMNDEITYSEYSEKFEQGCIDYFKEPINRACFNLIFSKGAKNENSN